jgi:Nucleotide modification associated domain 2
LVSKTGSAARTKKQLTMDIYVYKLVTDNGGAPCVWRGLLSLAICKPKIRKVAKKSSFIFGFGAKSSGYKERLIYVAKVTETPKVGDYYRSPKYAKRPDCIYYDVSGRAQRKPKASYHKDSDQRRKDVGFHFENAYVLLSNDFRYFGKKGTTDYKFIFPAIKKLVENLKRGHRVNHSVKLHNELVALKKQLWRKFSKKVIGPPSDSNRNLLCNRESPSRRVKC